MAALAEEIGLLSTRFMEGCAHALGLFAMKSEHHQLINDAAALQPVIGLLSSCCTESQREAALLLGQFASADSECKVQIVQRDALRPLTEMLQSSNVQPKEMSAFAFGRLAQDSHNQAIGVQ
ncbi:hypothetical protein ZIOFF_027976 [Zingiber officinale]|uniref:ARM repeat superfamily protein n=1 Tax=Zingiber officinale TaxID=94328 RepID=A0A8J5LEI3_ZINOF|nr:hypothetical protein ZIOFF_027976 [Zingiber officinale]